MNIYVIKRQDGVFFKSGRGIDRYRGRGWVADKDKAKVFISLTQARAKVTELAANGIQSVIISLKCKQDKIIDEKERVNQALQKKLEEKEKYRMKYLDSPGSLVYIDKNIERLKGYIVAREKS